MTEVTLTHIGGPTVLLEVEGWQLLTDPTFDAPGPEVHLRLGVGLPQDHRPGGRRRRPGDRTFEITFLDPGVQAYVFTFG
jgi:hypothetical protein